MDRLSFAVAYQRAHTITEEKLKTYLAKTKRFVNSCTLFSIRSDPDDKESLTPLIPYLC